MLDNPPPPPHPKKNIISQNLFPDHQIECLLYFAKSPGDCEVLALSVLPANLANCTILYNLNISYFSTSCHNLLSILTLSSYMVFVFHSGLGLYLCMCFVLKVQPLRELVFSNAMFHYILDLKRHLECTELY